MCVRVDTGEGVRMGDARDSSGGGGGGSATVVEISSGPNDSDSGVSSHEGVPKT